MENKGFSIFLCVLGIAMLLMSVVNDLIVEYLPGWLDFVLYVIGFILAAAGYNLAANKNE